MFNTLIIFSDGTWCFVFFLPRLIPNKRFILSRSWFHLKLFAVVRYSIPVQPSLNWQRILITNNNLVIQIRSVYTVNLHKLQMLLGHIAIYRVKNTLFPLNLIFKPSNPLKHTLLSPKLLISSYPYSYFHYPGKGGRGEGRQGFRTLSDNEEGIRKRILIKHFRGGSWKKYVSGRSACHHIILHSFQLL